MTTLARRAILALAIALSAAVTAGLLMRLAAGERPAPRLPAVVVSRVSEPIWMSRTLSGHQVEILGMPRALRPGPMRIEILTDPLQAVNAPVTLDLASPTMPAHGVARFPATLTSEGRYVARLDIPMEGEWSLYVNVGSDENSAVFELYVDPAPGEAPTHHLHGSHAARGS